MLFSRPGSLRSLLVLGVLLAFVLPRAGFAQSQASPADSSTTPPPGVTVAVDDATVQLGAVYQMDLTVQDREETSTFRVRAARLRATVETYGVEAFLQTEFAASPAIFDLRLRYRPHPQVRVQAGLFKSPFSYSHLVSRTVLPLAERPVSVDAIAPRRQVGVSVRFADRQGRVQLDAGVFNGNGRTIRPNDNNHFLYVGRLSTSPRLGGGTLSLGANAAYSLDEGVALGRTASSFTGRRAVFGADATYTNGLWLLGAEALVASLSPTDAADETAPDSGQPDQTAIGGYVVAGAPLTKRLQVVGRYDQFDPNTDIDDGTDLARVEAGLNYRPAPTVRFQLTGTLPVRDRPGELEGPRGTMRVQIALR